MRPPVTRSREAARTPTQHDSRTASWVGSGGESGALGTHHLCVAAGHAGATVLVRPEHVQSRRPESLTDENACFVVPASFAAPAWLAAAWRSHVPADNSGSRFLSD